MDGIYRLSGVTSNIQRLRYFEDIKSRGKYYTFGDSKYDVITMTLCLCITCVYLHTFSKITGAYFLFGAAEVKIYATLKEKYINIVTNQAHKIGLMLVQGFYLC